jgi:diguanylate cyclase (GGDEF)-like protein
MTTLLQRLVQRCVGGDLSTVLGRDLVEERYWSLRRQVPIVYILGFVNLSALELASTGRLSAGINLPTFIAVCGLIRLSQWFWPRRQVTHEAMVRRMTQTVFFATLVCVAVCARCIQLLNAGNTASRMAVMLFGGLTAIGVAYGLTALPAAGLVPLLLIIVPISAVALLSNDPNFAGAAFGLVVVAALTMRLLLSHSRHFTDVIRSRSVIEREQQFAQLAHREAVVAATTDFFTGLPNRRAFVAALELAASGATVSSFAVAILDLDRFKAVNDTFGHGVGDELLKEVAARLSRTVGDRGLVARLGGDEFGVLLPGVGRIREAQSIGREILAGVNGQVFIQGRQLAASACCGVAISRRREEDSPSRVMADADLALYQAKENPPGGLAVFEPKMEAPRRRRMQIETALLAPRVEDRFRVVFQPIFDLKSGRVIAHEALARWTDPELGPVPPSEFVPIAEQLSLIDDINKHLMNMAFQEARNWPSSTKLSFNLSAIQLCSTGTAKSVLAALRAARLGPDRLQVEVTETALLADFERARANLTELRSAGATIVLDDFGAGYASIGYLRELRFDQIKLDGSIVTTAQHGVDGRQLLRAVIGLCETLGVSTIAEHVESEELLKLVIDLGCSGGQGFWLMPPVSPEKLADITWPKTAELQPSRHAA